jgi:putative DNA methylase
MEKLSRNTEPQTLIESDSFPFEFLSDLAEVESWRKEIYRPVYHVHKWWATRLGSVFRGILLACCEPPDVDFEKEYYQSHRFAEKVVFDPFMGSGTTIGEGAKLGFTVVGREINPVAVEATRVALGKLDKSGIINAFRELEIGVGKQIRALYKAKDSLGLECDVLYYFWVKIALCPACGSRVDLFPSYVVARHASATRNPIAQILCPRCGDVFRPACAAANEICPACGHQFDPSQGPARNTQANCPHCHRDFVIAKVIRETGRPPEHRLYAKLLLKPSGEKVYLPATEEDTTMYAATSRRLQTEGLSLPRLQIEDGHNTRQVLNYAYRAWRDFFNDRQLLALGLLHRAICDIPDEHVRGALFSVFSSTLEFNNMFASYKGEGTGAVRHMFSHHILKPERTPIEANVWGTERSSGAFSTLFRSRLLRCIGYREKPFEIALSSVGDKASHSKVFGCSSSFEGRVETGWPHRREQGQRRIFISCGSSHSTGLQNSSVDFVVTDPPFFDNVHYSELADFFYAWQQLRPDMGDDKAETTRQQNEVQDVDPHCFAKKLEAVFRECHRVLMDSGLLVFTYHHSRNDGWLALCEACIGASFHFVNAHPVKAEMSVAAPKAQAKEPIDIDIVLVCRKACADGRLRQTVDAAWLQSIQKTRDKVVRYLQKSRRFSKNDMRVLVISQFLVELCPGRTLGETSDAFAGMLPQVEATVTSLLHTTQEALEPTRQAPRRSSQEELYLFT